MARIGFGRFGRFTRVRYDENGKRIGYNNPKRARIISRPRSKNWKVRACSYSRERCPEIFGECAGMSLVLKEGNSPDLRYKDRHTGGSPETLFKHFQREPFKLIRWGDVRRGDIVTPLPREAYDHQGDVPNTAQLGRFLIVRKSEKKAVMNKRCTIARYVRVMSAGKIGNRTHWTDRHVTEAWAMYVKFSNYAEAMRWSRMQGMMNAL